MRSLFWYAACLFVYLTSTALSQETQPDPATEAGTVSADGSITLQLNKLEAGENACNAYVVIDNQSQERLQELKVDVYLFDKEGIVLQGVALQFTDVGSKRKMVVPYELPDVSCDAIGRVLLNKMLVCTDASGTAVEGCGDLLVTSSLEEIPFEH